MSRRRLASILAALALAACGMSPVDTASGPVLIHEVFDARSIDCACEGDPGRPARVLCGWLALLDPGTIRERRSDRVRVAPRDRSFTEYVFRWEERDGALRVGIECPEGIAGDWPRRSIDSLTFVMTANDVAVERGPFTGCVLPAVARQAVSFDVAANEEFGVRGLRIVDVQVGQGCSATFYGRQGGTAEWHVDFEGLDGGWPSLTVWHDADPFDAAGEHEVLAGILRRATGLLLEVAPSYVPGPGGVYDAGVPAALVPFPAD